MKPKFSILFLLMAITISFSSCLEACETFETLYLQDCQANPTGVVGVNVGDYDQINSDVWHYTFDVPGSSLENCDLKFLESNKYIEVSRVELVKWKKHDVGKAIYIVDRIQANGNDSINVFTFQQRETYNGAYNNYGVCQGNGDPNNPIHRVRFTACKGYCSINDTFGLKRLE